MARIEKKTDAGERRQYLRMDATGLCVVYEILPVENLEQARQEILGRLPLQEDLEIETDKFWHNADLGERMNEQFSHLTRLLSGIDAKMDYLIALAEEGKPPAPLRHSVSLMDISGAGLSFFGQEEIPVGSLLRLHVQFSRFPLIEILAISRVMWCGKTASEDPGKRSEIGVQFEVIRDDDRERIFRFISKIERKMLRDRKEARTL